MQEQIRKCVVNCALVLTSVAVIAAVSDLKRSEQIIRPPEPAVMEMAAPEEIVTGVCTFGDCPVAVYLSKPSKTLKESQEPVCFPEEEPEEPVWEATKTAEITEDTYYSPEYFCEIGLIDCGGWTWSWYSEKVLPGDGLDIPGRHTSGGYVRDGDGYICLASDVLDYGTVIETPFGSAGRVYDCGVGNDYTVDVYVGW